MSFFNDKIAVDRISKARKDFEILSKPTQHFTKLELVNGFKK